MKSRYLAGLGVTAALAAAGTTVAVGQGTGATLGPKAQGSATFQVRIFERDLGFHCSNTADLRRCARQERPRVGSLVGGSGALFQGDERVGQAHFMNIVSRRGGANMGELFFAALALEDGTITIQGVTSGGETQPSSITGGSGAYAGARGFLTEEEAGGGGGQFRVNLTLRFIP